MIPDRARELSVHILGASGRGKSSLLEHMLRDDIAARRALCLLDPHGYLYNGILRWLPSVRLERKFILIDPSSKWITPYNPLAHHKDPSFAVDAICGGFAQVWGEDTHKTPLLRRCLRAALHVLAEHRLPLIDALRISRGGAEETRSIGDPVYRGEWEYFNSLSASAFQRDFASTNSRLMEFFTSERLRMMFSHAEGLNFGALMDEGAVVLVNLSASDYLSKQSARLLGILLLNDIFLRAKGRPPGSRRFSIYVDEAALLLDENVAGLLEEGRKFGVHLILAHQHLAQLRRAGEAIYSAVLSNAQNKIIFGGLSGADAKVMADHIQYDGDLRNLPRRMCTVKVVNAPPCTVRVPDVSPPYANRERCRAVMDRIFSAYAMPFKGYTPAASVRAVQQEPDDFGV